MPNAMNVTAGKPDVKGSVYRAPLGTTLPESVDDELDSAFEEMGYISDAGLTNSNSASNTSVKAWGGDPVLDVQTEKPDTYKMAFIEATNEHVLKLVYGDENVSGALETGLTVRANSKEQKEQVLVIDMILKGGARKRCVLPDCKVTQVADIVYNDSSPVGYDTTISCYPFEDWEGDTHREFILGAPDPSF